MNSKVLEAISIKLKAKIRDLKSLSFEGFILFVEQCQQEIVQSLSLSNVQIRRLNLQTLQDLYAVMSSKNGGQFVFRHGEQDFNSPMAYDEKSKKIIMMQADHNETDPITLNSAIEFIGTLLTLSYFKEKADYLMQVDASCNLRAKQPAEMLTETLGIDLQLSGQWKCINYQADLDPTQLDAKGNLEWNRDKVDTVVGRGTFDRIISEIQSVLDAGIAKNTMQIIITHTQQLDEFFLKASGTAATGRLSHYGFIFKTKDSVLRYEDGFYSNKTLTLQHEASSSAKPFDPRVFGKPLAPDAARSACEYSPR